MAEMQRSTTDFAGFQSEVRTLEAVPMRIDYQSPRWDHFLRPKGSDWLLSPYLFKGQAKRRETTHLDPYLIRDEFFKVADEKAAVRFLSEAGRFWIWEQVTYSQFKEWQEFLRWLRLDRENAMRTPEGKKAWLTAERWENHFFTGTDQEFTRARFQSAELPPEDLRRNEIQDRQILRELRGFALNLGQNPADSRVKLAWYNLKDGCAPEDWEEEGKAFQKTRSRSTERAPYLRIEARYILEAIAATIYADKAHRLKHGKCKKCGKIFEIKSDHGQQFCPAPRWLRSSPCKNAFLQHERREAEKARRKAARKLRKEKAKKARKA
jgi:hypothetical protein